MPGSAEAQLNAKRDILELKQVRGDNKLYSPALERLRTGKCMKNSAVAMKVREIGTETLTCQFFHLLLYKYSIAIIHI